VREKIKQAAKKLRGFDVTSQNSAGQGRGRRGSGAATLMGQGKSEIIISGADSGN
jgi:hypothetical protein